MDTPDEIRKDRMESKKRIASLFSDDDSVKIYREQEQIRCKSCAHFFNESELIVGRGLCENCLKAEIDYLEDHEN